MNKEIVRILAIDTAEINSAAVVLTLPKNISTQIISLESYAPIKLPKEYRDKAGFMIAAWHRLAFQQWLDSFKPDVVAIEGPVLAGHHLFNIGMVHMALLGECFSRKLDSIHMPVSTWKFCFTGRGDAGPILYRETVNQMFIDQLPKPITDYDVAAAIGIGYVSLRFYLWMKNLISTDNLSVRENKVFNLRRERPFKAMSDVFWHFYS